MANYSYRDRENGGSAGVVEGMHPHWRFMLLSGDVVIGVVAWEVTAKKIVDALNKEVE